MIPYTVFLFMYVYLCFIHKKNIFSPPPKNWFLPQWDAITLDESMGIITVRGCCDHREFFVGYRMALQRANSFSDACFLFSVL